MADDDLPEFVWLSAQGSAPVYVQRSLLINGLSPHFTRSFDGSMALPPRVTRLEHGVCCEPVYWIDVPPSILTIILAILAHPQLKYHYSIDKTGADAAMRQVYLRYYGLYSRKREFEDQDEIEEREEKRLKLDQEGAYDKHCLQLYKHLDTISPGFAARILGSPKTIATFQFINSYGIAKNETGNMTNYMELDGKEERIAWYFGSHSVWRRYRLDEILSSQHPRLTTTVNVLWERKISHGMREIGRPPATLVPIEIDPDLHEVLEICFRQKSQTH